MLNSSRLSEADGLIGGAHLNVGTESIGKARLANGGQLVKR